MMTFNIDLWQTLKEKSTGLNEGAGSLLKGNIFFGVAPANQKTPYCVLHVLDSGNDINAQTLCQNDEGYNTAGVSDIQFSVYATNDMAIDEILQELNNMIKELNESNINDLLLVLLSIVLYFINKAIGHSYYLPQVITLVSFVVYGPLISFFSIIINHTIFRGQKRILK